MQAQVPPAPYLEYLTSLQNFSGDFPAFLKTIGFDSTQTDPVVWQEQVGNAFYSLLIHYYQKNGNSSRAQALQNWSYGDSFWKAPMLEIDDLKILKRCLSVQLPVHVSLQAMQQGAFSLEMAQELTSLSDLERNHRVREELESAYRSELNLPEACIVIRPGHAELPGRATRTRGSCFAESAALVLAQQLNVTLASSSPPSSLKTEECYQAIKADLDKEELKLLLPNDQDRVEWKQVYEAVIRSEKNLNQVEVKDADFLNFVKEQIAAHKQYSDASPRPFQEASQAPAQAQEAQPV